jgi:peptide methionine sulfoxide reductase MsrA
MALQTFVGPWPLFQLLDPIHTRKDSLDRGSAHRKASTYTQNNTNTERTHTDIHDLSEIQTHDPSVRASEDSSCLRLRGHCDRLC